MTLSVFLGLLPALLAGIWPVFGTDPMAFPFPVEARGDLPFQADAARFLENGKPALQVSISIPEFALGGEEDSARIAAVVELLDEKGHGQGQYRAELSLPPPPRATQAVGSFPVPRRWIRLYPPELEGTAGLRVRVEDLARYKRGLWDRAHGTHRFGEAAARLRARAELSDPGWMSDLYFIWGPAAGEAPPSSGTGLRAVRARLEPNPYRFYGLYQPVLTVYWERYPGPAGALLAPGAPLLAVHRILRLADSVEVHASSETLRVSTDPQWSLRRFDLRNLAAGSYRYELDLSDGATGAALARSRGDFEVMWERSNWVLQEADLLGFGRVLLRSREFEDFSALDRGGMETYLRRLWTRLDPEGGGAGLERKFLQRVRYATENYRGIRPGIESDRGRVLVRYGTPDEISFDLNPQDEELLWITLPNQIDELGTEDLETVRRQSRRRTPQDNSAYEVWEYTIWGDPLLPEYVPPGQKHGMKFIFVDEMGTGDYTLAYTDSGWALQ
jgi:GWxTD domain-containing protein